MLVSGCTYVSSVPAPEQKPAYVYVVGPGDVLDVEVFEEQNLKYTLAVTPDGSISFPLAGTFKVIDKDLGAVADMVTARLLKSKGFTDPNLVKVTVLLRQSNAAQVHVVGEVGQQRNVPFSDRMGVVQAINLAGGVQWRTAKLESVRVVRGSLDHPTLIDLDLEDVYAGGERDVFLKPGDIVVVPPKYITMMDRYIQQLLSPISSLMGSTRQAAATAAGGL